MRDLKHKLSLNEKKKSEENVYTMLFMWEGYLKVCVYMYIYYS